MIPSYVPINSAELKLILYECLSFRDPIFLLPKSMNDFENITEHLNNYICMYLLSVDICPDFGVTSSDGAELAKVCDNILKV